MMLRSGHSGNLKNILIWHPLKGGKRKIKITNIIIVSVLPKGRYFTVNSRTKVAVMSKGRSSTSISGTKVAVFLGMNGCGSFTLLSAVLTVVTNICGNLYTD